MSQHQGVAWVVKTFMIIMPADKHNLYLNRK